jgi:hypothetical protein
MAGGTLSDTVNTLEKTEKFYFIAVTFHEIAHYWLEGNYTTNDYDGEADVLAKECKRGRC